MLTASISAQQGLYAAEVSSSNTGGDDEIYDPYRYNPNPYLVHAPNYGKKINSQKEYDDLLDAILRDEPGGIRHKKRAKRTKLLLAAKKKHISEINDPANKNKKKDKKASNNPLTQYAVTQAAVAAERNSSHQADIKTLEKEQKQAKDVIETNTERIVWLNTKVSDLSLTSKIGIAVAFGAVMGVGAYAAYNGYKTNQLKKK